MLTLSKKTDYALIALSYLAERPDRIASAREIAQAYSLPLALLMNILKLLHHNKVVKSTRGTKGGYQLILSPQDVSLYELVEMIDGPVHLTECVMLEKSGRTPKECEESRRCKVTGCPLSAPMKALHKQMAEFLQAVKVSDLIRPAKRTVDLSPALIGAH